MIYDYEIFWFNIKNIFKIKQSDYFINILYYWIKIIRIGSDMKFIIISEVKINYDFEKKKIGIVIRNLVVIYIILF